MASVAEVTKEPERPLSFGTGGRLGFDFWRMRIQTVLLMGIFCLASMNFQTRNGEVIWMYLGITLICLGGAIIETTRSLWSNRRNYHLFLKSQGGIDGLGKEGVRFSTGIERSSPLIGEIGKELLMMGMPAIMMVIVLVEGVRRSETGDLDGWAILGVCCFACIGLLSLTQIVLSFVRPAIKKEEEVVILDQGILWTNREPDWSGKFPNEFLPWSNIRRVVASGRERLWDKILEVDVDRWPWYRTIQFAGIREEDWERMVGVIGERVRVVRDSEN